MDFQSKIKNFLGGLEQGASNLFQGAEQAAAPIAQNAYNFGSNLVNQAAPIAQNAFNTFNNITPYIPFAGPQIPTPQIAQQASQRQINLGQLLQKVPTIQSHAPTLFGLPGTIGDAVYNYGIAPQIKGYGQSLEGIGNNTFLRKDLGSNVNDLLNLTTNPLAVRAASPILRAGGKTIAGIANAAGQSGILKLGPEIQTGEQAGANLFDFNKQLQGSEYNVFNKAYQKAQDILDIPNDLREHLPAGISAKDAYSKINSVVSMGQEPIDLIDQITQGLKGEGYTGIARPSTGILNSSIPTPPQEVPPIQGSNPVGSAVVAPKKASLFEQFFNRTRNVIANQGPAGQELAQRLQAARDTAETSAGQWVSQLPTVAKLGTKEFDNFVDVAEGKAQPVSSVVAQAAQEWNNVRGQVYNAAQQSGLDIGKLENYFPHRYDPQMFQGDNFLKGVQHLVDTGQAATPEEAAAKMRFAQDTIRNRRQGNLEISRLVDLPGYDRTKNALFGYLESAANRIGQVTHLGQNDSTAMGLINQIGQQGGDAQAAKNAFDIASGAKKYDQFAKEASGKLRGLQSLTKLGLGAITNTGQSVNTATVTGALRTMMSVPTAMFSPEAKAFALKSGVTLDGVLQDLKEGGGFSGKVLGHLTAPGFNKVETFNRTLAAWSGKSYAEDLAKQAAQGSKGAINELTKMGIDVNNVIRNGGALNEAEQIKAARNIVERTQFKVDPQDLPGWASSPWGKLLSQFKSFSYNQSAFVKNEILNPLWHGNTMPAIRFLVAGSLIGEGVGDIKAFVRGRDRPTDPLAREADNLNTVGGGGLLQDAYNNAKRGPEGVMSFLGGPTLGEVSKLVGGAGLALQGKPKTLGKQLLSDIPVAGQTISNKVFPPKNAYQSRTPDLPLEQASAAESNPTSVQAAGPSKQMDILKKKQLEQKIADLNKQEKTVFGQGSALNLPIFGQVSGLSDQQKQNQLSQLETQKQSIQDQLKKPQSDQTVSNAQYELDASRAKAANDTKGYLDTIQTQINNLGDYEKSLDPNLEQAKILQTQKTIEALTATKNKVISQGGITKPRRGKAIRGVNFLKASGVKASSSKSFKSLLPRVGTFKVPTVKKRAVKSIAFKLGK